MVTPVPAGSGARVSRAGDGQSEARHRADHLGASGVGTSGRPSPQPSPRRAGRGSETCIGGRAVRSQGRAIVPTISMRPAGARVAARHPDPHPPRAGVARIRQAPNSAQALFGVRPHPPRAGVARIRQAPNSAQALFGVRPHPRETGRGSGRDRLRVRKVTHRRNWISLRRRRHTEAHPRPVSRGEGRVRGSGDGKRDAASSNTPSPHLNPLPASGARERTWTPLQPERVRSRAGPAS